MRVWRISAFGGRLTQEPSRAGLLALLALMVGLCALVLLSAMLGSEAPGPGQALKALMGKGDAGAILIVAEFRLPRSLVAILAGGMLGLAGALIQGATRNPLADPALLGISQGAALTVIGLSVLAPGVAGEWRPPAAFLGGILVAGLILLLSHQREGSGPVRLLLTGIGIAAFLSALTTALLTYGGVNEAHAALAWISGSVRLVGWPEVRLLAWLTPPALLIAALCSRPLAVLRLGDELATVLGHRAGRARAWLMAAAAAMAAAAVSIIGPIAFVGLIAPHLAARLARVGPGLHLALSWAVGAGLTGLADLAGRWLFAPVQIPAGLVTALVGAPLMAALMIRRFGRKPA
ncbi:iron ABC transporter permease [Xinfangfangia sp. D13-10-4-6]|uniref:FecCD family ABC transporter permease n=1 Tax=Pseudogemmobacter hezensis TaxID=2737662 RepID=UPI00155580A6|nr:iron ABC transporter permease [Pseudogemmobacter hezensis]NPD15529.1 iron ABC transporter permease [Pseudogemmobacter hezensis]